MPADILLLEVGLGGRLDATNVIDRPLLTVQTPISFDHMQYLGDTLTAIAGEKAGIMKRGVPAVVAPQPPEAAAVFEARRGELGCRCPATARNGRSTRAGDAMIFRDAAGERRLPLPALAGAHQIDNAGTALACLQVSQRRSASMTAAIRRGLREVEWPARLQRLHRGPAGRAAAGGLGAVARRRATMPSGGEALPLMAADWADEQPALPLYLIFGVAQHARSAGPPAAAGSPRPRRAHGRSCPATTRR